MTSAGGRPADYAVRVLPGGDRFWFRRVPPLPGENWREYSTRLKFRLMQESNERRTRKLPDGGTLPPEWADNPDKELDRLAREAGLEFVDVPGLLDKYFVGMSVEEVLDEFKN